MGSWPINAQNSSSKSVGLKERVQETDRETDRQADGRTIALRKQQQWTGIVTKTGGYSTILIRRRIDLLLRPRERCEELWWVYVCLFVCLSARISQKPHVLHQMFCACCLGSVLLSLTALARHIMYFRFFRFWRHFSHNMGFMVCHCIFSSDQSV